MVSLLDWDGELCDGLGAGHLGVTLAMITATPRGPHHLCTQCFSDPKRKRQIILEYVGPTVDNAGDVYQCGVCHLEQWCSHDTHEADQWP